MLLIMLCIRSLELVAILYPKNISPVPPHRQPLIATFYSVFTSSVFLNSTYKWGHTVCVFLSLTYFTQHNALKVYPCCHKWQGFLLSHGWIIFLYIEYYIFWQTDNFLYQEKRYLLLIMNVFIIRKINCALHEPLNNKNR